MKRTLATILLCSLAAIAQAADTITVTWSYNAPGATVLNILGPDGVTALSGSGTASSGDGFALQLGYYTAATSGNPFSGTWVPVFGDAGISSGNPWPNASMGDGTSKTGTDIRFTLSSVIDGTFSSLPSAGQIMAIRYYNATSPASATHYGAASNPAWTWVAPADPQPAPLSFSMRQSGTVFQEGGSAPATTLPVPEPSTALLGVFGLAALGLRRRK